MRDGPTLTAGAARPVRRSRFPLGVVNGVFGRDGLPATDRAMRAAELGFEFIDLADGQGDACGPFALPVGERFSGAPRAGFTTAMPRPPGSVDDLIAAFRAAPGAQLEPTTYGLLQSVADVRAFVDEVPGLRITLDTGHIAAWGEDPAELIPLAATVQLRQARRGEPQVRAADGDVDFASFLGQLRAWGYAGGVSIEYFDLPGRYPLIDDPLAWALELADHVRPMLEEWPDDLAP